MDKITERETHDLMNVESFSQLPFIRPAPPPIKEKGIRLFGIEFGGATTDDSESAETTNTTNNNNINNAFETDSTTINKDNNNNNSNNSTENNVESNRRFECHYCCRNFPTSQALGGHQNAHKRERQHAKRAHLQSTMVHATSFTSDPHLYQHHHNPFINYRFTSSSSSSPTSYPTWNSNNNSSNSLINGSAARFYGTHSHSHPHSHANLASSYSQSQQQQPINGSPLAFWRIPNGVVQTSNPSFNNNHERSFQPLLASDHERPSSSFSQVGIGIGPSSSQNRYVYDSKRTTTVDHVSLDLHL